MSTKAYKDGSHSEGGSSVANGNYSHVEGYGTTAQLTCGHAEGNFTSAIASYTHSEGNRTAAYGSTSHAAGVSAYADHDYSWCWNGNKPAVPTINGRYHSKATGSFCINPANGISGFYIGEDNFVNCVLSAVNVMTDAQKLQLRTILGIN